MNFLDLCRRLRQETGISNTGPSNVTGQTGDLLRLVDWTNEAWLRLQSLRTDWKWMWREGTLAVSSGTKLYTLAADVGDLDPDTLYLSAGSAETKLTLIDYDDFRVTYRNAGTARPGVITIRPDGELEFNSTPDQAYTLSYEYFAKPSAMAEGISVPGIDEQYHMIIVWDALMEYAVFDEAPELYQKGKTNYDKILCELEQRFLPQIQLAGPIA